MNYHDETGSVASDDAVLHDAVDATVKVVRRQSRLPFVCVGRRPVTDVTSNEERVVTRSRESEHGTVVVGVVHVDRHSGFGLSSNLVYQRSVSAGSGTHYHPLDVLTWFTRDWFLPALALTVIR